MKTKLHHTQLRTGGAGTPRPCQARHFPVEVPCCTFSKFVSSSTMFKSTLKRLAIARGPPSQEPTRLAIDPLKLPRLTVRNNPFKAKKEWPPDFTKLHPKHQFRFEKRYRRRAKLRYQNPKWVRGVKIAANSSVVCSCALFPFSRFTSRAWRLGTGDFAD